MTHVQLERSEAPPETLWQEEVPLIDRIPRPVGMALLAVAFIALWQGVHAIGLFSPIILPPPAAVFRDILASYAHASAITAVPCEPTMHPR